VVSMSDHQKPIGIFDSGVGGLSVLQAIHDQLPWENIVYVADQAHVPYGPRPRDVVSKFAHEIVRFLLGNGAKLIVVACNTASAAALDDLRAAHPDVPFVGMEPAVKPAAQGTDTGVVGVLATPATFQGELYESTVERFAQGVTILQDTCPGLVSQIEKGLTRDEKTKNILQKALAPMLDKGVDKVVMGCTHYPFVIPLIEEIVGPDTAVIDPAPAVARQTGRLLTRYDLSTEEEKQGNIEFLTTGDAHKLRRLLPRLIKLDGKVGQLSWVGETLARDG